MNGLVVKTPAFENEGFIPEEYTGDAMIYRLNCIWQI